MARETNRKRERKDGEPRRFTFSLSTAGLVSLAVVGVAALVWVFILGVLVGRGYKPEQAVPQLAEIMPRPGENASAPAKDGVLKPEELEFFDTVKQKPGAGAKPVPAPEAETAPAAALGADKAAQTAPAAQATQADEGRAFCYVYQVASLKSPDMAREFAARLAKLGLSVSIEEAQAGGALWHRVLVRHTGTPESTQGLKDLLRAQGVDKPLMKSKVPAAAAGAN